MNKPGILKQIYNHKKEEVEKRKACVPVKTLENEPIFQRSGFSLAEHIQQQEKPGIIAEFKTRSPSLGTINARADISKITKGYMEAGASALSILTDEYFFGGSFHNLQIARQLNYCPVLQKDFILDTYQITEAKAYGADAILLIAAMLSKNQINELSAFANTLGMEALLEIHSHEELNKINHQVQLVGINNRNLNNFKVDTENAIQLVREIPDRFVKIAESGIQNPQQASQLLSNGFDGLLIGSQFMKQTEPEKACKEFIDQLILKQQNNILQ
jgi:indole-3-glycerol phosphate synthase